MKRLPKALALVTAVIIALALSNIALEGVIGPRAGRAIGHVAGRVVGRVISNVWHGVTPAAFAQETLKFEPVPAESADVGSPDRRRGGRTTVTAPGIVIKSGDIMRVGSDITIDEDQEVQGDVLAISGDVNVDGHVEGNVVSMGGDIRLSATARVDGDVVCMGGRLHEEPGATVGGQRVTALDPEGRRHFRPRNIHITPDWDDHGASGRLIFYLIVLGLVWGLTKVAPGSTGAALAALRIRPARSLGIGLLVWLLFVPSLIAMCLVVAILCITIIGIPLALIALLGYFVFYALLAFWGYAVGAALLGERVLERRGDKEPSLSRAAVAGVIVLGGAAVLASILRWLDFLPLVGALSTLMKMVIVLASIVLTSMGAGAWIHTEFTSGTLGRWWRGSGNRFRSTPPSGPAGPSAPPPGPGGPPPAPDVTPSSPPSAAPPPPPTPPPAPPSPEGGAGTTGSGGSAPPPLQPS
jgi:cytoskeletal protein CcmA (bactofilin family)